MTERKDLEGQEKELLDEDLEKTVGGVIGVSGRPPIAPSKTDTANRPEASPRTRG